MSDADADVTSVMRLPSPTRLRGVAGSRCAARIEARATGMPMTGGDFVARPVSNGEPRNVFLFSDDTDKLMALGDARGLMRRPGVAWGGDDER